MLISEAVQQMREDDGLGTVSEEGEGHRGGEGDAQDARKGLTQMQPIRLVQQQQQVLTGPPQVASLGKAEAHVYRCLALAVLSAPVLDALREGQISLGMAKAFTVSQDEALTLAVLAEVKGRDASEHPIKQALQPAAVSGTDRRARFVGQDAYKAAGGSLTRDLLSDTVALHDADLLQDLFTERLNAEGRKLAAGWKWTEVMADNMSPIPSPRSWPAFIR